MEAEIIWKYFSPDLKVRSQIDRLESLYSDINRKVNIISRKDIGKLYLHHVLHSLALAKLNKFKTGQRILDLGTGGGFPGIPLAIFYPGCQFTLVDSRRKKIRLVREISRELGLGNVSAHHCRVEDYEGQFDWIVSRAVAAAEKIISWSVDLLDSTDDGGYLFLKGGDLSDEFAQIRNPVIKYAISDYFEESYFTEKYIVWTKTR